ncbi:MAG: LPS assembly protein LptD, partial [Anaerohalosphaera sp.]|nr:LPS assembly protein LptD [Anaerohalosphaera sp.]
KKGITAKATDIQQVVVEKGTSLVTRFVATGEVFVKAAQRINAPMEEFESRAIYKNATASIVPANPRPVIVPGAMVPGIEIAADSKVAVAEVEQRGGKESEKPKPVRVRDDLKKNYPINIVGIGEPAPSIESTTEANGRRVATIIGRFYLWQAQDEQGTLLEFQADNAVLYYQGDDFQAGDNAIEGVLGTGQVESIYLSGNISMTEGQRTIRADEIFYDFVNRRAVAVNAELRQFDVNRSIPIYLRADKLRKVSDNVFQADGITLTTSEFYMPQISMTASQLVLTDLTGVDQRLADENAKAKYDGVLYDVSAKSGDFTYFKWPKIRTNFANPDVPIKRLSVGDSSSKGASLESRWYLSRLLGLKEPDGVDSDLLLDYYSQRGVGVGADVEYEREDHFGWFSGYMINDHGEDDLGRNRKNISPDEDWRGRFTARHRQYLPYDWQATFEVSYISDRNFIEYYYRNEFNTGKDQETLLHFKKLRDNWAFSILTKANINDFQTETEELPTIEYHQKAQSFWDHRLTYYGDTQVSRFRESYDSKDTQFAGMPEQFYTYFSSRHEVDMPFLAGPFKVVPYAAGTYGYDDQTQFSKNVDNNAVRPDDSVMLGEAGVRLSTMFWKADSSIRSELWDIDGIRHVVTPHAEAVVFDASDNTVDMRDVINFGVSQRWQTHRGSDVNPRTVDWMSLDLDATFVGDPFRPNSGAERFIWNNPVVPTLTR